jgi:hypothetical protein
MVTPSVQAALREPIKRSELRKRRLALARLSATPPQRLGATLTRVLPLADGAVDERIWSLVRSARAALHGQGNPSIFDVLMTLHEEGFRLFSDAGERAAFQRRAASIDATDQALRAALDEALPRIGVSDLAKLLATRPRRSAKRDVGEHVDGAVLASLLHAKFGKGKTIATATEKIAAALATRFGTWKALNESVEEAASVIDELLKPYALPSIRAALEAGSTSLPIAPNKAFEKCTIALDKSRRKHRESDATLRFAATVAACLSEARQIDGVDPVKRVKDMMTTVNGNGISWLLGNGRKALCDTELDELHAYFGADTDAHRLSVKRLRDALARLPDLSEFGDTAYPSSRSAVQGTLDSLITNYVNRVVALHENIAIAGSERIALPPWLAERDKECCTDVFGGLSYSADDFVAVLDERIDEARIAGQAVLALVARRRIDRVGGGREPLRPLSGPRFGHVVGGLETDRGCARAQALDRSSRQGARKFQGCRKVGRNRAARRRPGSRPAPRTTGPRYDRSTTSSHVPGDHGSI